MQSRMEWCASKQQPCICIAIALESPLREKLGGGGGGRVNGRPLFVQNIKNWRVQEKPAYVVGKWKGAGGGMQARRSASEKQRRRRMVNQRFLTAMAEMGIPSDRAELALAETGNVGVEACAPLAALVP